MYFSYKQAKLVRAVEPKSKIWGVLGGYPLIIMPYAGHENKEERPQKITQHSLRCECRFADVLRYTCG